MKIIEIIKNLLNQNRLAYAYENNYNLIAERGNRYNHVHAFWQPAMSEKLPAPSSGASSTNSRKLESKHSISDSIKGTRKLAQKLNKLLHDSPESLDYYLTKEDKENLQKLTLELIDVVKAMRRRDENDKEMN